MAQVKAHTRKTKKGQVRVKAHKRFPRNPEYGQTFKFHGETFKWDSHLWTSVDIPPNLAVITPLSKKTRFTDVGDTYALVDDVKHELEPILGFLEIHHVDFDKIKVGLKSDISFKQFNQYFPEISRKDLTKLFNYFEDNPREVKQAIKELTKK